MAWDIQRSHIDMARWSTKKRNLPNKAFLQTHDKVAPHIEPIVSGLNGPSLPPKPAEEHHSQAHNSVCLVHHQPIRNLCRDGDRGASDDGSYRDGAVLVLVEWGQHDLLCNCLVLVGHEGGESVQVEGHAPVWVTNEEGELHGGGHEWRGGCVEGVDGSAYHFEAGFVGTVDDPED
ncbi:hypothetical protein PIB30_074659 [Stylosanthes scabra]|uniref:Uncharacterized protein n=1 Tax=Stylosanthes scabra TaxID=79078 RepID=A0ABU6TPV7_9FABA|nr:hypothetical protein [Stylosanthes scabra]